MAMVVEGFGSRNLRGAARGRNRLTRMTRSVRLRAGLIGVSVLAGLIVVALLTASDSSREAAPPAPEGGEEAQLPIPGEGGSGEADRGEEQSPGAEDLEHEAYPRKSVSTRRVLEAQRDFERLPETRKLRAVGSVSALTASWRSFGPASVPKPPEQSYASPATVSGRVTSLALDPDCRRGDCRLWIAAAGGGIWRTSDALSDEVHWVPTSDGLTAQVTGALVVDPNDKRADTLYAGTGESTGESGVGLFRSTNGGESWELVPGSRAVTRDRATGAVAVKPGEPRTIYIGTAEAGRGGSRGGGTEVTPGAPPLDVYRSTDGGETFTRLNALPRKTSGVRSLAFDPADNTTVYAGTRGNGLWRSSPKEDGTSDWKQVFAPPEVDARSRTDFALVRDGSETRAYALFGTKNKARLYRATVSVPAARLSNRSENSGWKNLSSPDPGDPGYGSFNICGGQCHYDLAVATRPDTPDTVWLGGNTQFGELAIKDEEEAEEEGQEPIKGAAGASNGRAVVRSTDAGVHWSDMTSGGDDPPTTIKGKTALLNGTHPDVQAIALSPNDPDVAFIASDGGVVRTASRIVDVSDFCKTNELSPDFRARCRDWLDAVPETVKNLNPGLSTLQFNALSVAPDGSGKLIGGTQDNGTLASSGFQAWQGFAQGDGGDSGFDPLDPRIRWHTYFNATPSVNLDADDPSSKWRDVSGPLSKSGEESEFYPPFVVDPRAARTAFIGMESVWRTRDLGVGWQPLGKKLTSDAWGNLAGENVSVVARNVADTGTVWAATETGRVFVTRQGDAADPALVNFRRVDRAPLPERFPSAIVTDPADPLRAFVTFSGYGANTPFEPGHVFELRFEPSEGAVAIKDLSANLGDVPLRNVAYDPVTRDLFVATDFGVARRARGADGWVDVEQGMPFVATYGLTLDARARRLYAATFGRGVYALDLPGNAFNAPTPVPAGTSVGARANLAIRVSPLRGRLRVTSAGDASFLVGPFEKPASGSVRLVAESPRRLLLGRGRFSAAAGQSTRVRIRLRRRARRLLESESGVRATLEISAQSTSGSAGHLVRRVKLEPAR